MSITLNHTIIPSHDQIASANFYQDIFAFEFLKIWKNFAVVRVNPSLSLDFKNSPNFTSNHYCFKVSETQFDEIFQRIKDHNIAFGSLPNDSENAQINRDYGGRGIYFKDLDQHLLEIITKDYVLD